MERKPLIASESEEDLLASIVLGITSEHSENLLALPNAKDRFGDPRHKLIVNAILRIQERNEPIEFPRIGEELGSNLEKAGGMDYLLHLVGKQVTTVHDKWHVEQINKAFLRRKLHEHVNAVNGLIDEGQDEELLEQVEQSLESVRRSSELGEESMVDGKQASLMAKAQTEAAMRGDLPGISSGWEMFDDRTRGFPLSEMTVIGGRTSMGKTALAISLLANLIRLGTPAVFFSLEMPTVQLTQRLASIISGIELSKIMWGRLDKKENARVDAAYTTIENSHIFIDDTPGVTPQFIRAKARRLVKSKGVQVVLVDYIQIVKTTRFFKTRQEEVAEISSSLIRTAKEFGVAMVALAQLNREGEGKSPELSHFRECGAIEQDANLALLIHRPFMPKCDVHDDINQEDDEPEECYLLLAKNRNGPTGPLKMTFEGRITKFDIR